MSMVSSDLLSTPSTTFAPRIATCEVLRRLAYSSAAGECFRSWPPWWRRPCLWFPAWSFAFLSFTFHSCIW